MNDKERAAMQQALDALEMYRPLSLPIKLWSQDKTREEAITALREALAEQVEQEPVAWGVFEGNLHDMFFEQSEAEYIAKCKGGDAVVEPLYASPVRTKDLTDDELHQIWRDIKSLVGLYSFQEIARAVIAADREKNK